MHQPESFLSVFSDGGESPVTPQSVSFSGFRCPGDVRPQLSSLRARDPPGLQWSHPSLLPQDLHISNEGFLMDWLQGPF